MPPFTAASESMTTKIADVVDTEKLLDNFPISEWEVSTLLAFLDLSAADPDLPLSQLHFRIQEQQAGLDDDEEDNIQTKICDYQYMEEHILPEVTSQWIHSAQESISPVIPYHVTDEPTKAAFHFLEAVVSLLGRRGGTGFLPQFLFDCSLRQQKSDADFSAPTVDASDLISLFYRHIQAVLYLQDSQATPGSKPQDRQQLQAPETWVHSLQHTTQTSTRISQANWKEWVDKTIPEAMQAVSTLYHYILFSPSHPFGAQSPPQIMLPQIDPDEQSALWSHITNVLPLSLACLSPVFRGNWRRIYSSETDGLSFMSFQTAILGYPGPTLLLVRPRKDGTNRDTGVFGYYTDCPWQESNTWIEGECHDSFLLKIDKSLAVYYPTYESSPGHYMYLNNKSAMTNGSCKHTLQGLAIGGIADDTPRVHLTPSFEQCIANCTDTTYTSGSLLDPNDSDGGILSPFFDVDVLEVWAVNVTEKEYLTHKSAGQQRSNIRETARQRFAKVDRKQFVDDFRSGAVLNRLFRHRSEARGRHDFVALDDGSGYFLDEKPPSLSFSQERGKNKSIQEDEPALLD